jgi:hypothetical protein
MRSKICPVCNLIFWSREASTDLAHQYLMEGVKHADSHVDSEVDSRVDFRFTVESRFTTISLLCLQLFANMMTVGTF